MLLKECKQIISNCSCAKYSLLINQFHIFSIQKEPECIPAVRPAGSWRETGGRMGSLQLFNCFISV